MPAARALDRLREALASNLDDENLGVASRFTEAQQCAFLLQYNNDPSKASAAMRRSVRWRETYAFLPRARAARFEDVVFVHESGARTPRRAPGAAPLRGAPHPV